MTDVALWRRLTAEFIGSAFLAALVIGSGIAAQQLSPGNTGLQLFENAAATAAGLFAIILMFGPVSGGHFNPVVSFVDAAFGGLSWRDASAYLPAQVAGCSFGAVVANVMFSRAAFEVSTKHRASAAHFLSEIVATLGLLLVIFAFGAFGAVEVGSRRGRRLHRGRLLLHELDQLRQPGHHRGPDVLQHLRRDRTLVGSELHRRTGRGGRARHRADQGALPQDDPRAGRRHPVPARGRGRRVTTLVPRVLFLCVHNAGRSQMAAALLARRAGDRVIVHSAGSDPAEVLNPAVVTVMAEWDIDISQERPKKLSDEMARTVDVVVTMGCGDACPVYPATRYVDWDLPDPAGRPIEEVRRIRDEIADRVDALVVELLDR